jgi:hypothetical protein
VPRKAVDPAIRFWDRVRKSPQCWEWTGAVNEHGYGVIGLGQRPAVRGTTRVHRLAWMLTRGDPEGLDVLHHCDNPRCVKTEPDAQ